jgi:glucosamine--fructose-6-phosphate aminotransferase (isomerizing)
VLGPGGLEIRKARGPLENLADMLKNSPLEGGLGIGHTRWATHGAPSDANAHPHTDGPGQVAVVHNGIIENYAALKAWLEGEGAVFRSDTDTEVIAHLIGRFCRAGNPQDTLAAVIEAVHRLEGSYALAVINAADPRRIIVCRKESPLVLGRGNGANYIASDVPALLDYTRDVYYLEDREIAAVYPDRIEFYGEEGTPLTKTSSHVDWDAAAAEKGGYEHFMLKEIFEQPAALTAALRPRIRRSAGLKEINLSEIGLDSTWKEARRVVITACGTAYHAAVVGKYAMEQFARIPTEADIASEYRYRNPIYDRGDIFIIISQSGETADTLAAMRMARGCGARIIAITNAAGSTLAREADLVMYTLAGPEIAVASTKAFTTQLMCLYLIALQFGLLRGNISPAQLAACIEDLEKIPGQAGLVLEQREKIMRFAYLQFNKTKVFYMGRLFDYAASLESALKLKEISYIHSEAFAAGELKHGPIALVDPATLVIAFCTQPTLFDKMDSNIKEVKARGAAAAVITWEDAGFFDKTADEVFRLPRTPDAFSPMLSVIPCQLYAYYCSIQRGLDPDKPRNLAKSVTVE